MSIIHYFRALIMAQQKKIEILNDLQVKQIMKRLAYQVYENHFHQKELVVAGIAGNGSKIAGMLVSELALICNIHIYKLEIALNKQSPDVNEVKISDDGINLNNIPILVVDDVLNSGKTMLYALTPFVRAKARSIDILTLIDRSHKRFPVHANYIGISLSTMLQEHIEVTINKNKVVVNLV